MNINRRHDEKQYEIWGLTHTTVAIRPKARRLTHLRQKWWIQASIHSSGDRVITDKSGSYNCEADVEERTLIYKPRSEGTCVNEK